ncbi:hypothetical protein HU200_012423 [Digitaria exilis]|uniref:Dof zinc finger protein n=1 Tax=Digitaria exilis TaxID=1010633 RepID=A0A835FEU6_9POAL|nr:hypothetical protein HU200_012423 [Digitaria exilis]
MGSSSPSTELISCHQRPSVVHAAAAADRRLRPQHDQPLKCPRCESTHTKFCYYNNYSLSQPRYFCKTCRRYWTKGGSLRNVPVGGGCRKNKRASNSKKPSAPPPPMLHVAAHAARQAAAETGLHLSFSGMQQLAPPAAAAMAADPLCSSLGLLDWKYDPILGGSGGALDGASSEGHFAGVGMMGIPGGGGECHHALNALRYAAGLGEHLQLQGLPFGSHAAEHDAVLEVKPAERLLSLDWYGEASRAAPESAAAIGSLGALGLWSGMMGSGHQHHGSSAAI